MTSWTKPTDPQVDEAVRQLIDGGHYAYFFDRLKNPLWLEPLYARGFFRDPPGLIEDVEAGTITVPKWPESGYLARVASDQPELVLSILKAFPETPNSRVQEDLVEALLAIPAPDAATAMSRVLEWTDSRYRFRLQDKLGELAVHLAKGGAQPDALKLAKSILAVRGTRFANDTSSYDEWEYGKFLEKYFPELSVAAPLGAFALLNDILRDAIEVRKEGRDYSFIWRPAIEQHDQNLGHSIEDHLIDAVVSSAQSILRADPGQLSAVLGQLRRHKLPLFIRLELFLLQEFGQLDPAETAKRLGDRTLFDDAAIKHEYAGLLAAQFADLPQELRDHIIGWIKLGPDATDWCAAVAKQQGAPPSEDEVRKYERYWQRDRIAWFNDAIPDELAGEYEELIKELGPPDHPTFASYSRGGWVGPTSPKTEDDLRAMAPEGLLSFMKDWEPSPEWMADTRSGLGRTFEAVVSSDPSRFAPLATSFRELHPTYAGHLFSGLGKSKWDARGWEWASVFDLLDWVIEQEDDQPGADDDRLDHTWTSTKLEAVRLLDAALRNNGLEFADRGRVWAILEKLSAHPDPSSEDFTDWAASEPWTQSLNTVRGETFHTITQYALWCNRNLEEGERGKGFDTMPEVRAVLDVHLDLKREGAPAIRSVYGQFFPWLHLIDKEWASANAAAIFPQSADLQLYWYAAWGAYILFVSPYDEILSVLRGEYDFACEKLENTPEEWERRDLASRLSEHLMIYFWRGKLDDDAGRTLLRKFWEKAPARTRGNAIRFLGNTLADRSLEISPDRLEQLQEIWNDRLETDSSDKAEELSYFGSWFASGRFPAAWVLGKLRETVAQARSLKDRENVFGSLPSTAPAEPLLTAEALRDLINISKDPWGIDYKEDEIKQTLALIAASADGRAVELAQECVDLLAARGYLSFREALSGAKGDTTGT
ncbi:hypothetical protein [Sphingomonas sp. LaA6.9]|uniref:hypothetical protein n=1 Tax=Sphingomonas sp. LaA6.9 TaxID=2919914 RepID=UPI001F4FCC01|nr:hypothetical protein [Sphingomonas sp. LaA6.9]MCJ8159708.1 hypothetical protein [Sphingomonas sp. LaA6.9]